MIRTNKSFTATIIPLTWQISLVSLLIHPSLSDKYQLLYLPSLSDKYQLLDLLPSLSDKYQLLDLLLLRLKNWV